MLKLAVMNRTAMMATRLTLRLGQIVRAYIARQLHQVRIGVRKLPTNLGRRGEETLLPEEERDRQSEAMEDTESLL